MEQWGCFDPWLPYVRTSAKPPLKIGFFEKMILLVEIRKLEGVLHLRTNCVFHFILILARHFDYS